MKSFEKNNYPVFDMFNNRWALLTAGDEQDWNAMTISWGSLGTIWGSPGEGKPIATVYVNPERYTLAFMQRHDTFTISFFPPEYRKDLAYLGSHSGREGDKVAKTSLTPVFLPEGVTFAQAEQTFFCRKLYEAPFHREGMSKEINDFYSGWDPHWMFVGEIVSSSCKED